MLSSKCWSLGVAVLFLGATSLAHAQITTDVGVEFGLGKGIGVDCSADGVSLADCSPVSLGVGGEVAVHVHDHVAILGGVGWSTASLSTNATVHDFFLGDLSLPVDVVLSEFSGGIGLRLYSHGLSQPVRGFVQLSAGGARGQVDIDVLGFSEDVTVTGFALSPSAGVDVQINRRLIYRVRGGVGFGFSEGEVSRSLGVQTGLVFRFGRNALP